MFDLPQRNPQVTHKIEPGFQKWALGRQFLFGVQLIVYKWSQDKIRINIDLKMRDEAGVIGVIHNKYIIKWKITPK